MTRWQIYARDAQLRRQGEVDDFTDLEATRRWNDVGTWTFSLDRRSAMAAVLTQPGAGILITRDNAAWMSGAWRVCDSIVKGASELLTLSGFDDNIWLKRRSASPSPTESVPPYTAQADDVRTGIATTILRQYVNVNLGPGAVGVRRRAEVTLGTDPGAGVTVTGRARWQVLLTILQELALAGGIGFNLVQAGSNLEFQTFASVDRTTTARFSRAIGNLGDHEYTVTAPEANHIYVGGGGEGIARTIYEKSDSVSVAEWGRFEGEFVDRRDNSNANELDQAAADALTERSAKTTLTATLIDTPQIAYGTHYDLGSKVTVELDNPGSIDIIQDLVRRVTLKGDENGFTITPGIGTEGTQDNGLRIYQTVRTLQKRINNLERR